MHQLLPKPYTIFPLTQRSSYCIWLNNSFVYVQLYDSYVFGLNNLSGTAQADLMQSTSKLTSRLYLHMCTAMLHTKFNLVKNEKKR